MDDTHDPEPTSTELPRSAELTSSEPPRGSMHLASRLRTILKRRRVAFAFGLLVGVLLAWAWWSWRETSTRPASGPAFIAQWQRAVDADPEDLMARVELGYSLRTAGKNELALEQLNYVVKREPRNTAALYNRAMVYLSTGAGRRAEEDLWIVLDAEPGHAAAAVALGDYYAEKRQYRSLLVAVRPTLDKQPNDARLHYLTGLAYEKTGNRVWARARYELALKLNPSLLEAREGLDRLGSR